jgi:hypothetical protein
MRELPEAVAAFDAMAERFDERFGEWASVAAQRAAVRRRLLRTFPMGSWLLELAGGTAEDALYLAARGRRVLFTDGSPAMVALARRKADAAGFSAEVVARQLVLERIEEFALPSDWPRPLTGAYSNFAGLNCVADLRPVARGLARLLPAGAAALLVMFGPHPPGEVLVQLARADARAAFRRLHGRAGAKLGGREFEVHYPAPAEVAAAFAPWFTLRRKRGIGITVPPSAAEPHISHFPRLVAALSAVDRVLAAPLARLGDHVLLDFRRTERPVAEAGA